MYTTPQSTMPHPMEHKTVPPAKYRPATLGFTSHDWFAQLICSNLIFSCTSSSIRPHCPWHQSVTDAHNKPVCSEGTLSHVNSTSCNMSVQYLAQHERQCWHPPMSKYTESVMPSPYYLPSNSAILHLSSQMLPRVEAVKCLLPAAMKSVCLMSQFLRVSWRDLLAKGKSVHGQLSIHETPILLHKSHSCNANIAQEWNCRF